MPNIALPKSSWVFFPFKHPQYRAAERFLLPAHCRKINSQFPSKTPKKLHSEATLTPFPPRPTHTLGSNFTVFPQFLEYASYFYISMKPTSLECPPLFSASLPTSSSPISRFFSSVKYSQHPLAVLSAIHQIFHFSYMPGL